jgi:3-deoxy-manno-octulosonate cytidylyltransferase (CMP-KDO synthetase)
MKVIGVIPARYGSTRLPAKPLADIGGKTMVQHVYEIAERAKLLDSVVVATDDERVASVVRGFGGRAAVTNPAHASGTDRAAEVAASSDADIIVNVQGDEPLLDPEMIDECIRGLQDALLEDRAVGLSTIVKRVNRDGHNDSNAVKVVRDIRGRALYFSRSLIPYPRHRAEVFEVLEHIGLYAYTKDCLMRLAQLPRARLEQIEGLEQLRALENGIAIQTVETKCQGQLVSVDTPEDLERVRAILANGVKQ